LKTTCSGRKQKCYVTPEGKRYFHKKDIEAFLGYALATRDPPPPKEDSTPKVKDINETFPTWPDWADEVGLTKEWKVALRRLPSRLHRIFIPPGQQDQGFLWHRSEVEEYIQGTWTRELTPFQNSVTMAARMKDPEKRKRKRAHDAEADGEVFPLQKARTSPSKVDDEWARPPTVEAEVKRAVGKFGELLRFRGFAKGAMDFVCIGDAPDGAMLGPQICGMYYRLPYIKDTGSTAYQKIHCCADALACDRIYLCYRPDDGQWQICSMLKAGAPAYAYCTGDKDIRKLKGTWMLKSGVDTNAEFITAPALRVMCDSVEL